MTWESEILVSVFTVTSSFILATTIDPVLTGIFLLIAIRSFSKIPTSIMLSPLTFK